eukprot:5331481-Prymnesium_polylepis.1
MCCRSCSVCLHSSLLLSYHGAAGKRDCRRVWLCLSRRGRLKPLPGRGDYKTCTRSASAAPRFGLNPTQRFLNAQQGGRQGAVAAGCER